VSSWLRAVLAWGSAGVVRHKVGASHDLALAMPPTAMDVQVQRWAATSSGHRCMPQVGATAPCGDCMDVPVVIHFKGMCSCAGL
jgi:hypothetical protein